MSTDHNGMAVLTSDECLSLLSSAEVGRVGLALGALPVILPVNFSVKDGEIVFRTGDGQKLKAALDGAVIAFEADHYCKETKEGWSVLVQGVARLRPVEDRDRAPGEDIPSWAGIEPTHVVSISTEHMTGRRIQNGHERQPDAALLA